MNHYLRLKCRSSWITHFGKLFEGQRQNSTTQVTSRFIMQCLILLCVSWHALIHFKNMNIHFLSLILHPGSCWRCSLFQQSQRRLHHIHHGLVVSLLQCQNMGNKAQLFNNKKKWAKDRKKIKIHKRKYIGVCRQQTMWTNIKAHSYTFLNDSFIICVFVQILRCYNFNI